MPSQTKTVDSNETFIIIVPVFNEEGSIERTIVSWSRIVEKFPGSEILVINDGSTDKTKKKLDKLLSKTPFLCVIHQENKGHEKAISLGYKKAVKTNHNWVFQTDSDNYFASSDFYKLWEKKDNSHFLLGHRHKREDLFYRIALSKLISLWILILFGNYIRDSNIPFRLIKRDYLKKIIDKVPKDVFAPNIFLTILAARDGQNLYNIPVTLKTVKKKSSLSKLKLLKVSFHGFKELVYFRLNYI